MLLYFYQQFLSYMYLTVIFLVWGEFSLSSVFFPFYDHNKNSIRAIFSNAYHCALLHAGRNRTRKELNISLGLLIWLTYMSKVNHLYFQRFISIHLILLILSGSYISRMNMALSNPKIFCNVLISCSMKRDRHWRHSDKSMEN